MSARAAITPTSACQHMDSGKTTLTERILQYTGHIRDIHEVGFPVTAYTQTITVDRQMRRYDVTRFSFINEMDRPGAGPWRVINHSDRASHAAAVQVPIGVEDQLEDVVDLVRWKAVYNRGVKDVDIVESGEIPASALELATQKRTELSERLPRVKNTAVQPLLDGVFSGVHHKSSSFLQQQHHSLPWRSNSRRGSLKKGQFIFHGCSGMRIKVPKLVRVHRNEMETSMFVPDPVISLAIKPVGTETPNFSRALNRFQKEDPAFRVHIDHESKEVALNDMSGTRYSSQLRGATQGWIQHGVHVAFSRVVAD
ncbi:P-loop containing nucleoside triphosphate hydrolase protein [Lactarius pseudohatsudake]|nr:P-loop containing nucleoside triphosphate hydrolase protein [Lactarius pseudohatsudake]